MGPTPSGFGPVGPVAVVPVGPVTPVCPVVPKIPVGPVTPVTPVCPVVPVVPRKPAMPVGPVRPIPSFPLTEDTIRVLATMAPALRLLAVKVLSVSWLVHTLFPLLLTVMTYPPAIRPVPEYVVLFRRVSKSYSGVDMALLLI